MSIFSIQGVFIAISLVLFMLATWFLIWALYPRKRPYISSLSHRGSYVFGKSDPLIMYSLILGDLVDCAIAQDEIVKKKSNRYLSSLIINVFAVSLVVIGSVIQLCL